jgi:hypothetical protein
LTKVSSHELCETITDPTLTAWWDPSNGWEIGDLCNIQTTRLGGYLVQLEWSQLNGACLISPHSPVLASFGMSSGWDRNHPRFLADVNGDGRHDILGFANDGVRLALGNGDGTFVAEQLVLGDFGAGAGWSADNHPRLLGDVNSDGRADIVGFATAGVRVALSKGDGTFNDLGVVLADFGAGAGWDRNHPRFLADVNGDGHLDIIGFANAGVRVALGKGDGTFNDLGVVLGSFGAGAGW